MRFFWAWGARVKPTLNKTVHQMRHWWAWGFRMEPNVNICYYILLTFGTTLEP